MRHLPSHPPSAGALPEGEPFFVFLNLMVLGGLAPDGFIIQDFLGVVKGFGEKKLKKLKKWG